ncbi:MAG TPA: hypothetical protein DD423_03950 [Opitutae bacterium]|nr:hypothetical protein [Opitutae bacterium]
MRSVKILTTNSSIVLSSSITVETANRIMTTQRLDNDERTHRDQPLHVTGADSPRFSLPCLKFIKLCVNYVKADQ